MKLNGIKKAALAAAMVVIGTTGVFAQKAKDGPDKEPPMHMQPPAPFAERMVMGTISSINASSNTIVITDADGKNIKVHVNPLTHIGLMEPNPNFQPPKPRAKKDDKKAKNMEEPPFRFSELKFDNLAAGHWVTVERFNTNTETVEAKNITVHNSREVPPVFDTSDAK